MVNRSGSLAFTFRPHVTREWNCARPHGRNGNWYSSCATRPSTEFKNLPKIAGDVNTARSYASASLTEAVEKVHIEGNAG